MERRPQMIKVKGWFVQSLVHPNTGEIKLFWFSKGVIDYIVFEDKPVTASHMPKGTKYLATIYFDKNIDMPQAFRITELME